jgi:hypothetical protein
MMKLTLELTLPPRIIAILLLAAMAVPMLG